MTVSPRYPALYQINTRVWLTELSRQLGRPATLDDIPAAEIDRFAQSGFDWIWLLSVWQTGPTAQAISRRQSEWRREFEETLPDLCEEDITGSGFAIAGYTVPAELGGNTALARLRVRLRARGLKLMLDFVPNHMGLDHPWIDSHPEYFVAGTEADLATAPQNYIRIACPAGDRIFAFGRDPYFSGWPDTLQLDYSNPALQTAMIGELQRIAGQCDGVRCDMAMLVLPEVFERTWGRQADLFWPTAAARIRDVHPNFQLMAEVYWNLEWTLQQQGFDYTYDKRLYDRLRAGSAAAVRDHFRADPGYQDKLARFLENHDEPRAAATFPPEQHRAVAVLTFLSPGLRFFHQGQLEGKRHRISPHLVRGPDETTDETLRVFYLRLLDVLKQPLLRDGDWTLLDCTPGWEGNTSYDDLIVFSWRSPDGETLIVAVNYADHASQGHVSLPDSELSGRLWRLVDLLGSEFYDWQGGDLCGRGLYLDMPAWGTAVFHLQSPDD